MAAAYARAAASTASSTRRPGRSGCPTGIPNAGGIRRSTSAIPTALPRDHRVSRRARDSERWQQPDGRLFLGIDHTAIVVDDTDASLRLLSRRARAAGRGRERELRRRAGAPEQRLRRAAAHHGAPRGRRAWHRAARVSRAARRPARADRSEGERHRALADHAGRRRLEPLLPLARRHRIALVSPGPVAELADSRRFRSGALTRDPDGHGLRIVAR